MPLKASQCVLFIRRIRFTESQDRHAGTRPLLLDHQGVEVDQVGEGCRDGEPAKPIVWWEHLQTQALEGLCCGRSEQTSDAEAALGTCSSL